MAKKKMTILDFQKFKDEGRKFAFCTAYDYTTASIVDESDVEIILVGDSLGMIMLGYDTTVPVTVDDMIHHIKPVVKGAPNTFIIGDMPFGSYNVSPEQAIETANRLTKETLCDCVKLEGGVNMAPTIRRMVDAGINVMGHIGMTPQTATSFGGFKVQGGTPESARKLIEDAGYGPYFGHGFGHSLGIDIHEPPNAAPSNLNPMPEGAVISAEPGIYHPGRFGVRIEDVLVLRSGGAEVITRAPKELLVL